MTLVFRYYIQTGSLFSDYDESVSSVLKYKIRHCRGIAPKISWWRVFEQPRIGTFPSYGFFICQTFTCVFLRNINSKQIPLKCDSNQIPKKLWRIITFENLEFLENLWVENLFFSIKKQSVEIIVCTCLWINSQVVLNHQRLNLFSKKAKKLMSQITVKYGGPSLSS